MLINVPTAGEACIRRAHFLLWVYDDAIRQKEWNARKAGEGWSLEDQVDYVYDNLQARSEELFEL